MMLFAEEIKYSLSFTREIAIIYTLLGFVAVMSLFFRYTKKRNRRGRARGGYKSTYYDRHEEEETIEPAKRTQKTNIHDLNYTRKDSIMTKTELSFYRNLRTVVGNKYWIFSKVNLWEVIDNVERAGWGISLRNILISY